MPLAFTPIQLADFEAYVKVQKSGEYNMFDPRARLETSMDRDEWVFCMKHYGALEIASKKAADTLVKAAGKALEETYPFGYLSDGAGP